MTAAASWRRGDILLYRQVDALLRDSIAHGALKPGDRLPSEAELGAQYRVSRATVRQALDALDRDGLLDRAPGRGTFLRAPRRDRERALRPRFPGLALPGETARRRGTLLAVGRGPAPIAVTGAFGLEPEAETPFAITILPAGGALRAGLKRYLRPGLEGRLTRRSFGRPDLPAFLAARAGGALACETIWVEAILAEPRFAMMLKVPLGSPLLSIWWTEAIDGAPAVCSQLLQPAAEAAIGVLGDVPAAPSTKERRRPRRGTEVPEANPPERITP